MLIVSKLPQIQFLVYKYFRFNLWIEIVNEKIVSVSIA